MAYRVLLPSEQLHALQRCHRQDPYTYSLAVKTRCLVTRQSARPPTNLGHPQCHLSSSPHPFPPATPACRTQPAPDPPPPSAAVSAPTLSAPWGSAAARPHRVPPESSQPTPLVDSTLTGRHTRSLARNSPFGKSTSTRLGAPKRGCVLSAHDRGHEIFTASPCRPDCTDSGPLFLSLSPSLLKLCRGVLQGPHGRTAVLTPRRDETCQLDIVCMCFYFVSISYSFPSKPCRPPRLVLLSLPRRAGRRCIVLRPLGYNSPPRPLILCTIN